MRAASAPSPGQSSLGLNASMESASFEKTERARQRVRAVEEEEEGARRRVQSARRTKLNASGTLEGERRQNELKALMSREEERRRNSEKVVFNQEHRQRETAARPTQTKPRPGLRGARS